MKPEAFATKVEAYHLDWLCKHLDLSCTRKRGIDMYNGPFRGELKSKLRAPGSSFSVAAYQIRDFERANMDEGVMFGAFSTTPPDIHLFFAFLNYDLTCEIEDLGENENIEPHIRNREAWLVPWNWVRGKLNGDSDNRKYVSVTSGQLKGAFDYSFHGKPEGIIYTRLGSPMEERLLETMSRR